MIDESINYFGRRMIPKEVVLTEMCLSVIPKAVALTEMCLSTTIE
jgi:hypothetical protein